MPYRRDTPTVEELVAALGSDEPSVRLRAIEWLAALGSAAEPAVPALLQLFGRDVAYDESRAAIRALGSIPWGPHREQAAAILCALAKFAICHAGGLRALSALRRWYPEGPDMVSYREGGMARFLDGHEVAADLLDTLTHQRVVPDPLDVVLQWLHPNALDGGMPGRRWAEAVLSSGGLSRRDQRRIRAALKLAARQERDRARGILLPQTSHDYSRRPTKARKPFLLDGRRIDFEPHRNRTHHRITVDGFAVMMTYEEISSGITNSGAHGPRVRMAEQPMPWIPLTEMIEAPAPITCPSRRTAVCAWTNEPADCVGTVVYSSDEITLQFADDWSSVKISWHTRSDTSA